MEWASVARKWHELKFNRVVELDVTTVRTLWFVSTENMSSPWATVAKLDGKILTDFHKS
jgi:hypothetical protein